jgi:hypothetical protein
VTTKKMDPELENDLTLVLAQSHLVQTRLFQAACRGAMSPGVRAEVAEMLRDMAGLIEGNPT